MLRNCRASRHVAAVNSTPNLFSSLSRPQFSTRILCSQKLFSGSRFVLNAKVLHHFPFGTEKKVPSEALAKEGFPRRRMRLRLAQPMGAGMFDRGENSWQGCCGGCDVLPFHQTPNRAMPGWRGSAPAVA